VSVWAKSWAYEQTTGSPGRKSVLAALAEFADAEGKCRPGQKTIAAMTEFEDRTVRRHLAKLEEDGFIERTERRRADGTRTSDETRLLAPPERLVPPKKDQPDNLTGSEPSTGQKLQDNRTFTTDQPVNMSGPLLNEPSEEPSEEPVVGPTPDDTTARCLRLLLEVKGFPRDQGENAIYLSELRDEFPDIDAVEVCRDYKAWHLEHRQKKPSRLRLRNFFKQASKPRANGHAPPAQKKTKSVEEGYEWLFR
jgi:DNA-binding transcriptional ArsR family regulator